MAWAYEALKILVATKRAPYCLVENVDLQLPSPKWSSENASRIASPPQVLERVLKSPFQINILARQLSGVLRQVLSRSI